MTKTIKLSKGIKLRHFPLPPPGFVASAAAERDLARYGFPPRPKKPGQLKRWERIFAKPYRHVKPAFWLRDRSAGSQAAVGGEGINDPNNFGDLRKWRDHGEWQNLQRNWSGMQLQLSKLQPSTDDAMKSIQASWTIPNVYLPANAKDQTSYCASSWIGLGYCSSLMQCGCDSGVTLAKSYAIEIQGIVQPWWQWYPDPGWTISNLPVSPGDTLFCEIQIYRSLLEFLDDYRVDRVEDHWIDWVDGLTFAHVVMINRSSGLFVSFGAIAKGSSLCGDFAEWIVEVPNPPYLPSYGQVLFDQCEAGTTKGQILTPNEGYGINMVSPDAMISIAEVESPHVVRVAYNPPDPPTEIPAVPSS